MKIHGVIRPLRIWYISVVHSSVATRPSSYFCYLKLEFAQKAGCRRTTTTLLLALDWHTVKALDMQYMEAQLKRAGTPGPQVIGVDEISIRKGHTYRIVVSDLLRGRPIWFGGEDRSAASMSQFYAWLGQKKSSRIRLAVMDMWKPFRLATNEHAPQAAILFDKFHVIRHLGEALDAVRKSEYARLAGRQRRYIKGQKYTLLSRKENLTLDGKKALKTLLAANKRLNTAYVHYSWGRLSGLRFGQSSQRGLKCKRAAAGSRRTRRQPADFDTTRHRGNAPTPDVRLGI